jgi:hypothetical protein
MDSHLPAVPQGTAESAREGIATALEAAHGVGAQAQALIRAAQESFITGWQQAMWAGVGVMAVLLVYIIARGTATASTRSGR